LGNFPSSTEADVETALAAAAGAAAAWADTPGPQRGAILFRFVQLLEESKAELGKIVTLEQGKVLAEGKGEVGKAADEARFMAAEASRICGQTFPSERPGFSAHTVLEPIGVVAAISPWNFPVVAPVRKIAPALAYGNTVVFKPSSLTPWSAVYLVQLLEKAGVPAGVVNLVVGPGSRIGNHLVSDRRVRGITFTGSTEVGVPLYEYAARHLASVQLELGGKCPAVVIDCDNLEDAARDIVATAFACSGQRCTALSRVIVSEKHADALVAKMIPYLEKIKVGDGVQEGSTMGPVVSRAQYDSIQNYVNKGIESGCKLAFGGKSLVKQPDHEGYFLSPTLFDKVPADSPLAKEEIFGPVLPVIRVKDVDEAIAVANSTRYGLASAVFTSSLDVASKCMRRIQSGMIHMNHGTVIQSNTPFGGRKDSGQGAFSIGATAKEFFTNVKTIYTKW
jgi:aldehyde dehydrogenase (NAD+)